MARNHKFFFDADRSPRARGPAAERMLMTFLEVDVQGSDHVCHDLMDDLVAIEDGSDDQREFVGNAHRVTMDRDGVLIEVLEGAASDEPPAAATADLQAASSGAAANAADAPDGNPTSGAAAGAGGGAPSASGVSALASRNANAAAPTSYRTGLKHFREVLEDWEAFILDDELEDDSLLDDDFA